MEAKKSVLVWMQPSVLCAVFTANTMNMKNFCALITVVLLAAHAFAQQTETRKVGSFSGIKVTEGIDVFLQQGEQEQVKIEVDGTDPANIITEISGSYLKVHMKDGRYRSVDAKVYVTYTRLDKLSASSAGNIYSDDPLRANTLEISAGSAGSVEVTIDAGTVSVSASSAGDVELKGRAHSISLEASSAGEIEAYDLKAANVEAEASSAGSIKISVKESLKARASSGGSIRYRGNPERSDTNSSSGGSVKKTD